MPSCSALAEDERERIHKRASDGRKAARRAGVRFGRKPKLNSTQQARARELVGKGWGLRAVAAEMNVHPLDHCETAIGRQPAIQQTASGPSEDFKLRHHPVRRFSCTALASRC